MMQRQILLLFFISFFFFSTKEVLSVGPFVKGVEKTKTSQKSSEGEEESLKPRKVNAQKTRGAAPRMKVRPSHLPKKVAQGVPFSRRLRVSASVPKKPVKMPLLKAPSIDIQEIQEKTSKIVEQQKTVLEIQQVVEKELSRIAKEEEVRLIQAKKKRQRLLQEDKVKRLAEEEKNRLLKEEKIKRLAEKEKEQLKEKKRLHLLQEEKAKRLAEEEKRLLKEAESKRLKEEQATLNLEEQERPKRWKERKNALKEAKKIASADARLRKKLIKKKQALPKQLELGNAWKVASSFFQDKEMYFSYLKRYKGVQDHFSQGLSLQSARDAAQARVHAKKLKDYTQNFYAFSTGVSLPHDGKSVEVFAPKDKSLVLVGNYLDLVVPKSASSLGPYSISSGSSVFISKDAFFSHISSRQEQVNYQVPKSFLAGLPGLDSYEHIGWGIWAVQEEFVSSKSYGYLSFGDAKHLTSNRDLRKLKNLSSILNHAAFKSNCSLSPR